MRTAIASLLLLATVASAEPQYNQRIENLRSAAEAERKKLGLTDQKAKASYPTPEVTFTSEENVTKSCPGKNVDVKVAGKFVPKTQVVVESDDVKVVKEQLTNTGWTATLSIAPNAKPQHVSATFAAPVSGLTSTSRVLDVDCRYAWTLNLDTGATLQLTTEPGLGKEQQLTGQWSEKGKKPTPMLVSATVDNGIRLMRAYTPEEMNAQTEAMGKLYDSPEMQKINAKMDATMAKVEGCTKKPTDQMAPCMENIQKEVQKITEEREALTQKGSKNAPTVGCEELSAGITNGKLDGDAKVCVGKRPDDVTQVSGTYKAL